MATSTKTLTPTNQTITIPDMTERPNVSLLTDAIGKEADAINALNSKLSNVGILNTNVVINSISVPNGSFLTLASPTPPSAGNYMVIANVNFSAGSGNRILLVDAAETDANSAINSVLAEGRATLQKVMVFGLNETDHIYIRAYQNSGSAMSVSGSYRFVRLV